MATKQRIEFIDAAKGVAILAIVIGHLGFSSDGLVVSALFQFHVPLFFLAAGFFVTERKPLGAFAADKAKRLLIPFVLTCAVLAVCLLICGAVAPDWFQRLHFESMGGFALAALYGAGGTVHLPGGATVVHIGAIWFLEALFVANVALRLCLKAGKWAPVPVLACFAVAVATQPLLYLPFNVQPGLAATLFLYVGYLMKNGGALDVQAKLGRVLAHPLTVLACLAVFAVFTVLRIYPVCVGSSFGPFCVCVLSSLAASWLVFQLCRLVCAHAAPVGRALQFFGRNSLLLLCVHLVCLDMMSRAWLELVFGLEFGIATIALDLLFQLAVFAAAFFVKEKVTPLKSLFG